MTSTFSFFYLLARSILYLLHHGRRTLAESGGLTLLANLLDDVYRCPHWRPATGAHAALATRAAAALALVLEEEPQIRGAVSQVLTSDVSFFFSLLSSRLTPSSFPSHFSTCCCCTMADALERRGSACRAGAGAGGGP